MLRRAGLALSLGALAAYGLRNAIMADHQEDQRERHLDASGPRDVVFCHQCEHEWYRDQSGLICPQCEGEITEIISPESDPRPGRDTPESIPELEELQYHNPWSNTREVESDPEEADIEEHVTHGPHGYTFHRTIRTEGLGGSRRVLESAPNNPAHVINDFQAMIGNLMGPGLQMGEVGRSGPEAMFPPLAGGGTIRAGGVRLGGEQGPRIMGGRYTFTTGNLRPRDTDGPQSDSPPVDDLATILGSLFGQMGPMGATPEGEERRGAGGMPMGLPGLIAQLLNPQNAVHGDAVYSQEALDRIISQLMEQHPTSNAPGPAPAESIAALPKKKLDEKMLGPEGKGECSVCMDDVFTGDEVVSLPCSHWFHESCAAAWLGEHNTCPICRKGIDGEAAPNPEQRRSSRSSPGSGNERENFRGLFTRRASDRSDRANRNEARLEAIRDRSRISPTQEERSMRWQSEGGSSRRPESESPPPMPGSYTSTPPVVPVRRRASQMSDSRESRDTRRDYSGAGSRRSSGSGSGGSGSGTMNWIRDRFGGNSSSRRNE